MQQTSRNESTEKHVCNEQTSPNMSRNSCLKHFCISRDTNEIVLHVIKQCLQAGHHGATENAGVEKAIRSKLQGWKMQEWKMRE